MSQWANNGLNLRLICPFPLSPLPAGVPHRVTQLIHELVGLRPAMNAAPVSKHNLDALFVHGTMLDFKQLTDILDLSSMWKANAITIVNLLLAEPGAAGGCAIYERHSLKQQMDVPSLSSSVVTVVLLLLAGPEALDGRMPSLSSNVVTGLKQQMDVYYTGLRVWLKARKEAREAQKKAEKEELEAKLAEEPPQVDRVVPERPITAYLEKPPPSTLLVGACSVVNGRTGRDEGSVGLLCCEWECGEK
eukprot:854689-Pelagomonas_calceolata.AAC.5